MARTCMRDWQQMGIWNQVQQTLLELLNKADKLETDVANIDSIQTLAFGAD